MDSRMNISLTVQMLKHRLESRLREALIEKDNCGKNVASASWKKQVDEAAVCSVKVVGSEEEEELKFYNDLFKRFHYLYNDYDTICNYCDDSSDGFVWDYCLRTIMNDISRMGEILMERADLISLAMNGNVSLKWNTETPKMSCLRILEEKWSLLFWLTSNSDIVELRFGVSRHKLRKTIFSINIVELFNSMLICLSKRLDEKFFNAIIYQNLSSNFNAFILKFVNEYYQPAIINKSKNILQNFFDNFIETWTARCEKFVSIKLNLNDKFYAKLLKCDVRCLLRVVVMELLDPVLSMLQVSMSEIHHDDYLRNLLRNGLPKACLEMYEIFEKNMTRIYLNHMKDALFYMAYSILTCKSEFHQYVLIENDFENLLNVKSNASSCDQYMKHYNNLNDKMPLYTMKHIYVSNGIYMLMLLIRGIAVNTPAINIGRDEMAIYAAEILEKIISFYKYLKYSSADGREDFFNHDPTVSYVDTLYATHCLLVNSMQLLSEGSNVKFPFLELLHDLRRKATLKFQAYINSCSTINFTHKLPKKIWQAAMGQLISISVAFFSNTILKMDTLTSVMKKNLKNLLSPFISKCGKLLEIDTSEEIEAVCKDWQRFNEIFFIIHSSVRQVELRWANGSGPLAVHLTVEELYRCLNANFQHTRSLKKLLSKIKE
ncbi:Centromere/kinetochore protein zw10 -like protein [Trichinella nativa]|uniref:Centromere/kinetochore protein zw10-like protein n=1 Tax=Trichinella nativa TaxID=6335 RepID=A0A0V1LNG0_9BILA|nr:Centromere/kinetochore protein zw10 -like protein [Trichinella nativa]